MDSKEKRVYRERIYRALVANYKAYAALVVSMYVISTVTDHSFIETLGSLVYFSSFGYFVHMTTHTISFVELYDKGEEYIKGNKQIWEYIRRTHDCVRRENSWLKRKICEILDFHRSTHHDTNVNNEWLNQIYEFMHNICGQGLLFVLLVIGLKRLNLTVGLFWALLYATVHIFNYAIWPPRNHKEHHEDSSKNLGMDIYDYIFETKSDYDDIEICDHAVINVTILTYMIYYWKKINA